MLLPFLASGLITRSVPVFASAGGTLLRARNEVVTRPPIPVGRRCAEGPDWSEDNEALAFAVGEDRLT